MSEGWNVKSAKAKKPRDERPRYSKPKDRSYQKPEEPYTEEPEISEALAQDLKELKGCKAIIVCDLNGMFVSPSSLVFQNNRCKPRPGLDAFVKLASKGFGFALMTSVTRRKAERAADVMKRSGLPFKVFLTRESCLSAPTEAFPWAVIKEPSKFFEPESYTSESFKSRVFVVDETWERFHEDDRDNVVKLPSWHDEWDKDRILKVFVDELLKLDLDSPDFDTRNHGGAITATLFDTNWKDRNAAQDAVEESNDFASDEPKKPPKKAEEPKKVPKKEPIEHVNKFSNLLGPSWCED